MHEYTSLKRLNVSVKNPDEEATANDRWLPLGLLGADLDQTKQIVDNLTQSLPQDWDEVAYKNMLTPYTQESMVATRAYTIGQYICIGKKLYKTIAAITINSTLNSTNVEEVHLAEATADAIATNTNDISDLKESIKENNSYDFLDDFANFPNTINNGVTFAWNGHTCTVTGQLESNKTVASSRMYFNENALPIGIEAGKDYYFQGERTDNNIRFMFLWYRPSGDTYDYGTPVLRKLHVPDDAKGLLMRIDTISHDAINGQITVGLWNEYTNKQITNIISNKNFIDVVNASYVGDGEDLDNYIDNIVKLVASSGTIGHLPYENAAGLFLSFKVSNFVYQVFISNVSQEATLSVRRGSLRTTPITWTDWKTNSAFDKDFLEINNTAFIGGSDDYNDYTDDCAYLVSAPNSMSHAPAVNAGGVLLIFSVKNFVFQILFGFSTANANYNRIWMRRGSKLTTPITWTDWNTISGSGNIYNITQNINQDTINNDYDITVNPSITTDSNGWLNPSGTDDMTSAIMALLNTGYCHLAPGTFLVSGNIDMPAESVLEGCGAESVIKLIDSVTSGYIVKPSSKCTIKNILFSGGDTAPADVADDSDVVNFGSRHGVYISGYNVNNRPNIVTGCYFENFDGSAIYMYGTGGETWGRLIANDIYIDKCMVGINIDYQSEYNKFSNVIIRECNHACINNGGNNVFEGCTFHGVVGFVIDNSGSDKRNNGHGSCVGCTFNHINNQNVTLGGGNAIIVRNCKNGFLFENSQLWYGDVVIENSKGVHIGNSLFGGKTTSPTMPPEITISGGTTYPAFFTNCVFNMDPIVNDANNSKFINCYNFGGNAVS